MEVEVVRSSRRRHTVQAQLIDGRMRLCLPARMTRDEEAYWVAEMQRRLGLGAGGILDGIDLVARAADLAGRYGLPVPQSIRWVENQRSRWGSCTPADGSIRLSSRLKKFPGWVVDYVIVHELAHLLEPGHGAAFKALERRYRRSERAIGFLLAKGMGGDDVGLVPGRDRGRLMPATLPLFEL